MNLTRAVTLFKGGNLKKSLKQKLDEKWEEATVALVRRALSSNRVQLEIARAFEGRVTPMCRALDEAVGHRLDEHRFEIDADEVTGLDRYVENILEQAQRDIEIHSEQVKDFDESVISALVNSLTR